MRKANAFGLFDTHGNVYEWCSDWYDEKEYTTHSGQTVQDPQGPQSGPLRVYRGGCWSIGSQDVRSANRNGRVPENRINFLGFRVVTVPSVK